MSRNLVIIHNPKCGKSRDAVSLAIENGIQPQVREYLKNPLNKKELEEILELLKLSPIDLLRKKEKQYQELFHDNIPTETEALNALVDYPILLERPIAILGKKARICRPADKLLEILPKKRKSISDKP